MAAVVSEMMRIMIFFAAKTPLSDANGNDSLPGTITILSFPASHTWPSCMWASVECAW